MLYSTFFVATGSNARVFADALGIFRKKWTLSPRAKVYAVRALCVLFPVMNLGILLLWGSQSVSLVFVGAISQAALLPLLAFMAVYLRLKSSDPRLRPGPIWTGLLLLSFLAVTAVSAYQVYRKIVELAG